ncbi:MAG: hypothetical protein H5T86_13350, partial [Armatimonadetes bacterium]|nr:hypothetical protein [Armatimonadota bacterium]
LQLRLREIEPGARYEVTDGKTGQTTIVDGAGLAAITVRVEQAPDVAIRIYRRL